MTNLEVEPLSVPFSVHVILQPEIIFNIIHFDGATEIASFESWLENQNVILMRNVNCVLVIGLTHNLNSLIPRTYSTWKFSLWCELW